MGKKTTYDQGFKLETIRLVKEQDHSVRSVATILMFMKLLYTSGYASIIKKAIEPSAVLIA